MLINYNAETAPAIPAHHSKRPPPDLSRAATALRHWCLFLDVDGTLLEFADTPDAVTVPAELRTRLQELHQSLGGALALISGRRLRDLDSLFAPLRLPAAGIHGLERRDASGVLYEYPEYEPCLAKVREDMEALVYLHRGLLLEDKGTTLALHYRRAPELAGLARNHTHLIAERLGAPFEVMEGDMLFEIKPSKPDKATAINAFLEELPFTGRVPIFIGDDTTDRDGFHAVKQHGGLTIAVGERIVGDRQLANPRAVRRWLNTLLTSGNPWQ